MFKSDETVSFIIFENLSILFQSQPQGYDALTIYVHDTNYITSFLFPPCFSYECLNIMTCLITEYFLKIENH